MTNLKAFVKLFVVIIMAATMIIVSLQMVNTTNLQFSKSGSSQAGSLSYLEAAYQSGRSQDMYLYLQDQGLYGPAYQKYWELVDAYHFYEICLDLSKDDSPQAQALYDKYLSKLKDLRDSCRQENKNRISEYIVLLTE